MAKDVQMKLDDVGVVADLIASSITKKIDNGKWKCSVVRDPREFLIEQLDGLWIPNLDKVRQVRDQAYHPDFIIKIQNKIENTGNLKGLKKPGVLVYFPKETILEGVKIPAGTYILIDGTHSNILHAMNGIFKRKYYVINYETDLESSHLAIRSVGNMLNDTFIENNGLSEKAMKMELDKLIDFRILQGWDWKPTEEEKISFCTVKFPGLSRNKLGQWIAHHEQNRRGIPWYQYTQAMLDHKYTTIETQRGYDLKEWYIQKPRTLRAWNEECLSNMIAQSTLLEKNKCVVILYANTSTESDQLHKGSKQRHIKQFYRNIKNSRNYEEIDVIFLNHLPPNVSFNDIN